MGFHLKVGYRAFQWVEAPMWKEFKVLVFSEEVSMSIVPGYRVSFIQARPEIRRALGMKEKKIPD